LLPVAGWTAEGGLVGTRTKGRARYGWTRHNMEECGRDRRKNYVSHYQNNIQRQRQLAEMWDRGALSICGEMKSSWGVCILLHYERKKQCNMGKVGNLETKRESGGGMERSTCVLCTNKESRFHMLLICAEMQRWRKDLLSNKRPHVYEEMSLREILTVNKNNEQESLDIFAYRVKCKWEDQMKKEFLKLREEHERDCT